MTPKEKKEYLKSIQATWTKDDIKRIRRLYPKVCLYCGSKTKEQIHVATAGKYKGAKSISWHCTNPKCDTDWGGYV